MGMRYLAYGSNLCAEQMARRCPAAVPLGAAELPGWRFAINCRGVATLVEEPAARASGLLWDLSPACEDALDEAEGVKHGTYRRAEVEVGGAPALVYLAAETRPGMPRPGYLERILAACGRLGLSTAGIKPWARPVQPWLVREVMAGYGLDPGGIHGPAHWLRVRANGLTMAARTPGADSGVVELFALLHDCRRREDGRDLGHGERAAAHAGRLARDGLIRLDPARLDLLVAACAGHEHGGTSADPTIGCCWDADRLELSRLHRRPIARFLSTDAAHDPALQAGAWQRGASEMVDTEGAAAWGIGDVFAGGAVIAAACRA
ncbi:gamma-glutamylcyclotransferase [Falsiroseomonas sp. CW058]|uniref:gamma-glutamylcyclotransferase n=1 Tax=Falsiroseomonas sp. CW058 TaxID=3388664 RepID=UPI003D311DCC